MTRLVRENFSHVHSHISGTSDKYICVSYLSDIAYIKVYIERGAGSDDHLSQLIK